MSQQTILGGTGVVREKESQQKVLGGTGVVRKNDSADNTRRDRSIERERVSRQY